MKHTNAISDLDNHRLSRLVLQMTKLTAQLETVLQDGYSDDMTRSDVLANCKGVEFSIVALGNDHA